MKYKVIAFIQDGVILAQKNIITCWRDSSFYNEKTEERFDVEIGDEVKYSDFSGGDCYWYYSFKEWDKINKAFMKSRK